MFKMPFMNRIKSLRAKITVMIVIIALIVQGLFSFVKILDERNKAFKNLESTKEQIVDDLSNSMIAPLWNYNYDETKLLINIKLKNRDFVGIVIHDIETKEPLVGLQKDKEEIIESFNFEGKKHITVSKELSYEDTVYWKADFYFTDDFAKLTILQSILFYVFSALILTFIISLALFLILNKLIIQPINITTLMLKDISEGKGDLTQKIQINSDDEFGELANYFNEFINSLNMIVKNIKIIIEKTKKISNSLASSSHESSSALEQISKNIESIKNKVFNLDEQIGLSNQAASEVKEFISEVVHHISNQASEISQSSVAIEEISGSINNIASVSEDKLKITQDLEKIATTGSNDMNKTVEIIDKVTSSAEVIMEMIEVINGIANQTNLLAMNAAIESAHAGEAGRGFSVVADEIRKLAEGTATNSKDISNSLKTVIEHIHESEQTTNTTGKSFTSIVEKIKIVADSMVEMKNGMVELATSSNQIMESLKVVINTTTNVKDSSVKMDEEAKKITESLSSLEDFSFETKNGIQEVEVGIKEVFTGAEQVSKVGAENAENINELEKLIGQFKTD